MVPLTAGATRFSSLQSALESCSAIQERCAGHPLDHFDVLSTARTNLRVGIAQRVAADGRWRFGERGSWGRRLRLCILKSERANLLLQLINEMQDRPRAFSMVALRIEPLVMGTMGPAQSAIMDGKLAVSYRQSLKFPCRMDGGHPLALSRLQICMLNYKSHLGLWMHP
ncbi:hypothetical protein GOP47_0016223 [Adiantum capillus-veneris]|uniref:Uncharacterized protein n=1 Tax=Adiantum capillus-veneris TaxID=13818 RepID=A0A9D4UI73_ADICA|nr:hypothetical protein GOP47_0016223 [Adiantum capillus-veneris]